MEHVLLAELINWPCQVQARLSLQLRQILSGASCAENAQVWTRGSIQTGNYGFKVFAVPSALLNEFSGHFTVQLDQICNIGSLFHGHTTCCRTRCYA